MQPEYTDSDTVNYVDGNFDLHVNGHTGKVMQVRDLMPYMDCKVQLQTIPPYMLNSRDDMLAQAGGGYPFKFAIEFPTIYEQPTKHIVWLRRQPIVHFGAYIINNLDLSRLPADTWNENMSDFLDTLFGLFIAIAVKVEMGNLSSGQHRFFVHALRREIASTNLVVGILFLGHRSIKLVGSHVLPVKFN